MTRGDPETLTHRALSDPKRARILRVLRASEEPLDTQEVAGRMGLHPNTVRFHLDQLAEAGLVVREPEDRDRPGRPRILYRAGEAPPGEGEGYRFLARILAGYVESTAEDPGAVAEEAGRAWGRYLAERPAPFQQVSPEEALRHILELLTELGFDPEPAAAAGSAEIRLHRCPFLEVAQERSEVVCGVHLGLMRGVLEELGEPITATALEPFVEPSLCIARFG